MTGILEILEQQTCSETTSQETSGKNPAPLGHLEQGLLSMKTSSELSKKDQALKPLTLGQWLLDSTNKKESGAA